MSASTMFLLKKNLKLYSKVIFFVVTFLPFWSKSLNVFEMSLIGVGSGLVYHQYFDKSLDKSYKFEEEYSNKMSEKGTFVDSTIAKHLLEYESKLKGEKQRKPNPNVINSEPTFEEIINIFRKLDDDNVNIIGALDMGMSQAFFDKCVASAWAHVEWLGFDHWKAIRSITSLNAKSLKIDNYKGYLKQGYIADMVSFDNDPTLNIRNLETIPNSIIKAGKVIKANGQLIT